MTIATSSGIFQDPPGSGSNTGGGGGAVSSVFTRTGAVTAQTGDYTAAQVTGALLNTNNLSDVSNATTALSNLLGAPLASPALTGTPTAPTAVSGVNNTQLATTQYVTTAIGNVGIAPVSSVFTRTGAVVATSGDYSVRQVSNAASQGYVQNYAIPLSTIAASGQLIVGSNPSAVAPINLGTNGQVLTVSGAAPYGIMWQTPASTAISSPINLVTTTTNPALANKLLVGDTQPAFQIDGSGKLHWGVGGSTATDTSLNRDVNGNLVFATSITVGQRIYPSLNTIPGGFFLATDSATLGLYGCSLDIVSVGSGFKVAEGSNAKQGTATLTSGVVSILNTSVTATSRIFITAQSLGTITSPAAYAILNRGVGSYFTITSSNPIDTSTVAWEIFEVG